MQGQPGQLELKKTGMQCGDGVLSKHKDPGSVSNAQMWLRKAFSLVPQYFLVGINLNGQ